MRTTGDPTPRPVFLLGLPRSGTTLVQRVLAAHPDVATAPEPWVLLPALSGLRDLGVSAPYEHDRMVEAVTAFVASLDGGRTAYLEEVAEMARRLYGRAAGGAPLFLDKTPRYHLIADDLLAMFPEARFVLLWRQPLAVVSSMMSTWYDGRWKPHRVAIDLYDGVEALTALARREDDRVLAVRYEDVVTGDPGVWAHLFAHLELTFDPSVLTDFGAVRLPGVMGDPKREERTEVSTASIDAWRQTPLSGVRKRWMRQYLRWVGRDRLAVMGYDLDELDAQVRAVPTDHGRDVADTLDLGRSIVAPPLRAAWTSVGTIRLAGRRQGTARGKS